MLETRRSWKWLYATFSVHPSIGKFIMKKPVNISSVIWPEPSYWAHYSAKSSTCIVGIISFLSMFTYFSAVRSMRKASINEPFRIPSQTLDTLHDFYPMMTCTWSKSAVEKQIFRRNWWLLTDLYMILSQNLIRN